MADKRWTGFMLTGAPPLARVARKMLQECDERHCTCVSSETKTKVAREIARVELPQGLPPKEIERIWRRHEGVEEE